MSTIPVQVRRSGLGPLPLYLSLTFAISWGGILLIVGPDGIPGAEADFWRLLPVLVAAMLLGPPVGAIVASVATAGREGLHVLWARLRAWRAAARWYAIAAFTAPAIVLATLLPFWATSGTFRPGLLSAESPLRHLALGLLTGVAAGTFEEIGWTGVAIPAMRRRLSATLTGLWLGIIWGLWHLLASWWGSWSRGDVALLTYLLVVLFAFLVPYRITPRLRSD